MRVMAHVKPERVRQKTVPRGLNRHQGGSVLFYARARVFPCTRLPQILRTRTFPLSGSTFPRVCMCVSRAPARLNLATCSFSMLDTLSLLPIPANSAIPTISSPLLATLSLHPFILSKRSLPSLPFLFFSNNKKLAERFSLFPDFLLDSSSAVDRIPKEFFLPSISFRF